MLHVNIKSLDERLARLIKIEARLKNEKESIENQKQKIIMTHYSNLLDGLQKFQIDDLSDLSKAQGSYVCIEKNNKIFILKMDKSNLTSKAALMWDANLKTLEKVAVDKKINEWDGPKEEYTYRAGYSFIDEELVFKFEKNVIEKTINEWDGPREEYTYRAGYGFQDEKQIVKKSTEIISGIDARNVHLLSNKILPNIKVETVLEITKALNEKIRISQLIPNP